MCVCVLTIVVPLHRSDSAPPRSRVHAAFVPLARISRATEVSITRRSHAPRVPLARRCRSRAAHVSAARRPCDAHVPFVCGSHAAREQLMCRSRAAHTPMTCRSLAARAPMETSIGTRRIGTIVEHLEVLRSPGRPMDAEARGKKLRAETVGAHGSAPEGPREIGAFRRTKVPAPRSPRAPHVSCGCVRAILGNRGPQTTQP